MRADFERSRHGTRARSALTTIEQNQEEHSDDCLHLNVWTPAVDRKCRPVMVLDLRRGFVIGTGSWPTYEASVLRSRRPRWWSMNYRLGPLGFLRLNVKAQRSLSRWALATQSILCRARRFPQESPQR